MKMHRIVILTAVIAVIVAIAGLAGYIGERNARIERDRQVRVLAERLEESEARVRLGRLLGTLLHLREAVTALNYGQAQALSSRFFDDVRTEIGRSGEPAVRSVLQGLLELRDRVTSALARGDAEVVATLQDLEVKLRGALGYPVPQAASGDSS